MEERLKPVKWLLVFPILAIMIGIPLTRLAFFAYSAAEPGSSSSSTIEIHKGQNPSDIIKRLASNKIITDAKNFMWLGRLTRNWKRIKAGEYQVSPSMSPLEIFSILTSGISIAHPVTVREGENTFEVTDDLTEKGLIHYDRFTALCQNPEFISSMGLFKENLPKTLEGYFFPDTYFFNRSMNETEIAKQMVKHFFAFWGEKEEARAKELQMSRNEIITLASIIEKETGAAEERALISSVFHNRLQKKMKLQSDPTTIYGMWKRFKGKIHKSDLSENNPYNTYSIEGLPIGPISNPGKEAIHAALYPAESPYFFFVSHNDGTHQFSRTFAEHTRAVRKFQIDPKARQGKSWRDHLRKTASD